HGPRRRVAHRARCRRRQCGRRHGDRHRRGARSRVPALLAAHGRGLGREGRSQLVPALRGRRRGAPPAPTFGGPVSASASRKYVLFGAFTALSLVLDQWTKTMARASLKPLSPFSPKVVIDGFFNLRYSENPGVAFGMLQQLPGGRLLLALLSVRAFALVLPYLRKPE